jgi:hypothetical protein
MVRLLGRISGRLSAAENGELEQQELEDADAAHQLGDRREAAGLPAQLAMHTRQGRKDRRELPRHIARFLSGCPEEEFVTPIGIADLTEQCFDAVHGGQATPADRRFRVTAPLPACD